MNKEELIGKLQMVYVGDKNALNELIYYYDVLKLGIERVQQENKQLKEVIDKTIEELKKGLNELDTRRREEVYIEQYIEEALNILKEVK